MEIIDRIYDLIKTRNTNANRVTKGCGLNSNIFTFWKNGRQKPSLDALIKIANYFNVSLDYLVGLKTLSEQDTLNNATINSILNRISQLDELQKIQVMAYIDGLQGVKSHTTNINTRKLVSDAIDRGINENKTTQPKETKIS